MEYKKNENISFISETSLMICTAKEKKWFQDDEDISLKLVKKQNSILIWLLKLVLLLSSL